MSPSPHIAPSFCCNQRITRCGGAYSFKYGRRMRRPYAAFSVFQSVRPATAALLRPRDEAWCKIRASSLSDLGLSYCGKAVLALFSAILRLIEPLFSSELQKK